MATEQYLGLIGTTFRRGGAEQLGFFGPAVLQNPGSGSPEGEWALANALGVTECVYLATCNRVEIIFAADRKLDIRTVRRRLFDFFAGRQGSLSAPLKRLRARGLHAYFEDGAIERLFVIAGALDSMVPGEAQILGQLKEAAARASKLGLLGIRLQPLFDAAFQTAKAVREHGALGRGRVSMVSLTESVVEQALQTASITKRPRLAIVGVGEMSRVCAHQFGPRDDVEVFIVNRGLDRARALAQSCGAQAMCLADFLKTPGDIDVMVSATASPKPLFDEKFFGAFDDSDIGPPLVVDLAVPPDVDATAARAVGAEIYDLDRLAHLSETHRRARQSNLAQARDMIDKAVEAYEGRLRHRAVSSTIQAFRRQQAAVLAQKLTSLPIDGDAPAYQRWAQQLTAALAHGPTQGLKQLAQLGDTEAIHTFAHGAGLKDWSS